MRPQHTSKREAAGGSGTCLQLEWVLWSVPGHSVKGPDGPENQPSCHSGH